MAGFVITALFSISMWVAIWLLTRRRHPRIESRPAPGQLSAAERRRLYKRLGIDPRAMARQRPYLPVPPRQPAPRLRHQRSTRA